MCTSMLHSLTSFTVTLIIRHSWPHQLPSEAHARTHTVCMHNLCCCCCCFCCVFCSIRHRVCACLHLYPNNTLQPETELLVPLTNGFPDSPSFTLAHKHVCTRVSNLWSCNWLYRSNTSFSQTHRWNSRGEYHTHTHTDTHRARKWVANRVAVPRKWTREITVHAVIFTVLTYTPESASVWMQRLIFTRIESFVKIMDNCLAVSVC